MSDVVIRCPNCGTTHQTLGECDACHEATTRHFCPNHTPGRWLDGPTCPTCGARFTGRPAAAEPPPSRSRPIPPRPVPPGEAPRREIPRRETPPRVRRVPPTRPPVAPEFEIEDGWIERDERPRRPTTATSWPAELRWPAELPMPKLPIVRVGFGSVLGCLGKLVMLAVVLLVLAALAFFGYCGAYAPEGAPRTQSVAPSRPVWPARADDQPAHSRSFSPSLRVVRSV